MSAATTSLYRTVLQVPQERIAPIGDAELSSIMRQLLQAQAYKCGSPCSEIQVNTEGSAKDDGCDGWSATPAQADEWLGSADTCWQFKAGSAGQPSRLRGEVTKPIPKETLCAGGRFVVVASGSTSGKKGVRSRKSVVVQDAMNAGIPHERIEVVGSERLTTWCNQNPAVAAQWADRPAGLWTLNKWRNSNDHQVAWQSPEDVQEDLGIQRDNLDFVGGTVEHLHIYGDPGVGKTRRALELCRAANWRDFVIYVRQARDFRLTELIDCAAEDSGVQLMVVADEVQADQLRPLRDSIEHGKGRIRLITIGHCKSPDPRRIPAILVKPLGDDAMRAVVNGWHPAMPREHVDFVVRFSDGYVGLARLSADAVALGSVIDVRSLLERDEIRGFLDAMLGAEDRRPLHVIAALSSVGWIEDAECEGKAVAEHLGLEWEGVLAAVERFHGRFGIAPRGGRYRYVSPTPLGAHLAVEAWTTYPSLMKSLPEVLPTEAARDSYYRRLQSIASNPHAREFARNELDSFFHLDDFVDFRAVRRWSALASADTAKAARNILTALSGTTIEQRKRIEDRARLETVWALVRLSWNQSSFRDAVTALALLAEAENATWANNATSEFVARFQVFLGGTSVAYRDRLAVLDELLELGRPIITAIGIKALAQIGNRDAARDSSHPISDQVPEPEWQPRTHGELRECVESALVRLIRIAEQGEPEVKRDLVGAAKHVSMMVRQSLWRARVAQLFDTIRCAYPELREQLRRIIDQIVRNERKFWKQLPEGDLAEIEAIRSRLEESSFQARLHQLVGQAPWERDELPDLAPIAQEFIADPELLARYLPWLTSGDAADAWRFGEALAAADTEDRLSDALTSIPGRGDDLRLICGYACFRRRLLGDDWYDAWVSSQLEQDSRGVPLLFDLCFRCGATVNVATLVADSLRKEQIGPEIAGKLGFGDWSDSLPAETLRIVLEALADTGHSQTASKLLAHRMKANPAEAKSWESLALRLVQSTDLIRTGHTSGYHWRELATILVANHAREIAAAILREQADRDSHWFAEYSEAAPVLRACVDADPHGVWQELEPYLSSPEQAYKMTVGFPPGLLECMPADEVWAWIEKNPKQHASLVAELIEYDSLSNDANLASRTLGEFADIEGVGNRFFCNYMSGSSLGHLSTHWEKLANSLNAVASSTSLPKLRRWANDCEAQLRRMAERERRLEEEEELPGR